MNDQQPQTAPDGVEDRADKLATAGIAGLIHPDSRVERLQERRDRDRAAWLGVNTFTRPPTPTEQALTAALPHVSHPDRVRTRVTVQGGLYRRSWPAARGTGGPQ